MIFQLAAMTACFVLMMPVTFGLQKQPATQPLEAVDQWKARNAAESQSPRRQAILRDARPASMAHAQQSEFENQVVLPAVDQLDPHAIQTQGPSDQPVLPVTELPPNRSYEAERGVVSIPFRNGDTAITRKDLQLRMNNGLITLIATEVSLREILSLLASDHGFNLVTSESIDARVTVSLNDVPLADALNAVLSIHGLSWSRRNNIISVSSMSVDQAGGAIVQGRVVRVYPLSYINAKDVESVVKGLLSTVGTVQSMSSDSVDTRRTRDRLIVEDLPDYLDRVDSCISQLDRPPQQVQILAHVLEVELTKANRHGVSLTALLDVANSKLSFSTPGFANPNASPAMLLGLDGSHLDGLVEALINTTDARTLASPRIMVTHGQEAKIQIGGRIGFRQSTTTETSTVQGVEFLDVGVVLTVTPYIGESGQILLRVRPEVSDGQLNLDTELPDEKLTMVESTVLLNSGQGMVIGGLIREDDLDNRNKVPILGEMWMVGGLFQNVRKERARTEVIVVIQSTIVPGACPLDDSERADLERASTRLFHGPLQRQYRPWEPGIPEVVYRPGTFKQNVDEFCESEGTRLLPETPRGPTEIIYGARFVEPIRPEAFIDGTTESRPMAPMTYKDAAYNLSPERDSRLTDPQDPPGSEFRKLDSADESGGDADSNSSVGVYQTSSRMKVRVKPAGVPGPSESDRGEWHSSRSSSAPSESFGITSPGRMRSDANRMASDDSSVNSAAMWQPQNFPHIQSEEEFPPLQRFNQSTQSRNPSPQSSGQKTSIAARPVSWFRKLLPKRSEQTKSEVKR